MDLTFEENRKSLDDLRLELGRKHDKWVNLQVEWAPSFRKEDIDEIPKSHRPSYLKHVMASALHHHIPTRSKCMFEVAVEQMTESTKPRAFESLDQIVRLPEQFQLLGGGRLISAGLVRASMQSNSACPCFASLLCPLLALHLVK